MVIAAETELFRPHPVVFSMNFHRPPEPQKADSQWHSQGSQPPGERSELSSDAKGSPGDTSLAARALSNRDRMERALAYLHEQWNRSVTLTEVARQVDLSEYHFARLFKSAFGVSPHKYLIQLRIERAKEMLAMPDDERPTLASIALQCGFYDQPHFTRMFKRMVGQLPSEFIARASSPSDPMS